MCVAPTASPECWGASVCTPCVLLMSLTPAASGDLLSCLHNAAAMYTPPTMYVPQLTPPWLPITHSLPCTCVVPLHQQCPASHHYLTKYSSLRISHHNFHIYFLQHKNFHENIFLFIPLKILVQSRTTLNIRCWESCLIHQGEYIRLFTWVCYAVMLLPVVTRPSIFTRLSITLHVYVNS